MRRCLFVMTLVLVVVATSCMPKKSVLPQKAKVTPTATVSSTKEATSSPSEWTSYQGKAGVTVDLPSEEVVLPLESENWLFMAVVTNLDSDLVYRLYVTNLGGSRFSSVEELKNNRGSDPNHLVIKDELGKTGKRSFYRIVAVNIPPDPKKDTTEVYYYYFTGEKQLIVVLFECFSCGVVDKYFPYWEDVLSKVKPN